MKTDEAVVVDILRACRRIGSFIAGLTVEQFRQTAMVQSAVIRELEVIGEAAKRLSAEFREGRAEIPWKSIIGMRDRLIHGYDDIDLDTVWRVAQVEVPALQAALTGPAPNATT
jgi:uncharacterized protein with HEPN domain